MIYISLVINTSDDNIRFRLNDPNRLPAWIDICHDEFVPIQRSRICGKHFPTTMYFLTPKERYHFLNKNAIPVATEQLSLNDEVVEVERRNQFVVTDTLSVDDEIHDRVNENPLEIPLQNGPDDIHISQKSTDKIVLK